MRSLTRITLIVYSALFLFLPAVSFAADPPPTDTTRTLFGACKDKAIDSAACSANTSTRDNPVNHYIKVTADIMAFLTGVIAVMMVIISGFNFITSGGNSEKAASARRRLLAAVIGLAIVALAWTLITFLTDALVKT